MPPRCEEVGEDLLTNGLGDHGGSGGGGGGGGGGFPEVFPELFETLEF